MPVDTRSKRASSVQILMPWALAPVFPDGTLDQGDRQHIALAYSGILAIAPIVPTTPSSRTDTPTGTRVDVPLAGARIDTPAGTRIDTPL